MSKEMVISANPHETRVAILEEGQLCEYYVEREKEFALVGSIYKGRVTRVLPGMQSSFVDIGLDSDAFLYVTDFLEGIEEFDHVVTTVEDKLHKMEEQGGQVFAPTGAPVAVEPVDVEAELPPPASLAPETNIAPAASIPPSANVAPANNAFRPDRPRFDNRSRGGRDFGRRGGGRGGRFGRGGGRGGNQRYGRDLPSSKYASPHLPEDRPDESGPANGSISIILPGESLAKYRDKVPEAAVASPHVEEVLNTAESSAAVEPVREEESVAPAEARATFDQPLPTGLEPLPGESLSKWQRHEPLVEEHEEEPAAPAAPLDAPVEALPDTQRMQQEDEDNLVEEAQYLHEAAIANEAHTAAELSEDEAATLAEHVAEAQIEEEAREAQRRDYVAAAEAGDADISESELDEAATSEEEHELAEEEAEAEGEGMIAPPAEEVHAKGFEVEAAHAENGSPDVAENPAPQEPQIQQARIRDDFRARMQHPARRGNRDRGRRDDRGRRPQHGHGGPGHHRFPPRRPQLIADMLKQGQEIIVQIAKEPLGKKGARITSHVALPGRFLVYMPTLDHTGVSRKIASAEDRARLRHLVNEAKGASGGGFIVRTAAGSATADEVRADVEFLTRTWSEIKSRSEQRKAPSILHRDLNLVERILRDYITPDFQAIWVDSEEEYTKVVEFMSRFQPQMVNRVKLYTKDTPVFEEFGIQQEIDKGLRPKVWLKSGGYIVINHTEALVAIDVNTGKFVGKGSNRLEDTIVRTNTEAVKEIVRQMRLRDLGGIIIIDFIDMEERRNREKVMAALEDALRADRAPSKVLRFNEFGLVAITRKRTKQALERTLCQPCPYCTGSGMVKSIATLTYEIQTEARKMAPEIDSGSITLRVHPEISKALKTRESSLIEELERWTKKSVIIQADPTLHWEQYDIY
ncbi:MAG: Rne/Rng family ribonuclease [Candidatus Acidiferrales bacterium]